MAGVRNLTQIEATRRAHLLRVRGYDVVLDLTDGTGGPGEGTFRSTTRVDFACTEPGAETFIEVAAHRLHGAHLNGEPIDTSDWSAEQWSAAHRAGRRQHAGRRRRLRLLHVRTGPAPPGRPRRQRGLPLQPVRDGRRAAGLRLFRPARPQGDVHVACHRPSTLDGCVQRGRRQNRTRTGGGDLDRPLRAVGAHEHLCLGPLRRPLSRGSHRTRRHRPGPVRPGVDGRTPRRR